MRTGRSGQRAPAEAAPRQELPNPDPGWPAICDPGWPAGANAFKDSALEEKRVCLLTHCAWMLVMLK